MSSYYSSSTASLEDILESERENIDAYVNNKRLAVSRLVNAIRNVVVIDRYRIGGSIGKGTSLGPNSKPDLDINLFINGAPADSSNQALKTFLDQQRNEISNYLQTNCSRICKVYYDSPMAVGVYVYSIKTKVDLIPGINFGSAGKLQYETILNRIVNAKGNLAWANVCYAEESVRFVASKDDFLLNVVRAAKYWNARCVKMGPLSGRSVIVETVALKAAQDEVKRWGDQSSLRDALERFFKYMVQPCYSVRVLVPYDDPVGWRNEARWKKDGWGRGPSGYIVDPVNPYRNFLADSKVKKEWHCFQDAARASLRDLNSGEDAEAIGFYSA